MDISQETLTVCLERSVNLTDLRQKTLSSIEKIDYIPDAITYEEFFTQYLLPNKLCILGPWATDTWRSRAEWVTDDGRPDFDFLEKNFGDVKCPVANCNAEKFSTHPKSELLFKDFVRYMKQYLDDGQPPESECLYLKDWHFVRCFPEYGAYQVPKYFQSDWMNEFWDKWKEVDDDYRFVYIGPKGSWTPFHSDVFRSFSWSANICGRKKWIFYPPGEEKHLEDKLGNLPFDVTSSQLEDKSLFPNVEKASEPFVIYQERGEVVFVPSGWHHQVYNLEDTISINHNWMNGCNIDLSWRHLVETLRNVEKEIDDCRNMENWGEHCQMMLKACAGIDYREFYLYLFSITSSRVDAVENFLSSETPTSVCDRGGMDSECAKGTSSNCSPSTKALKDSSVLPDVTSKNGSTLPGDTETTSCERMSSAAHDQQSASDNSDTTCVKSTSKNSSKVSELPQADRIPPTRSTPINPSSESENLGVIRHFVFDLTQIRRLLEEIKRNREFLQIDFETLPMRPKQLLAKITTCIDTFSQTCDLPQT